MPLTLPTRHLERPITEQSPLSPAPAHRGRTWLAKVFDGETGAPPLVPCALPPADRSAVEYDTVARALVCPDLFLVDAQDRHARERVLADLARIAALRAERVLIVSPDPAAADRLAAVVATEPSLKVIRALADDENPTRPLAAVNRLTSVAVGTGRVEQMKREAAAAASRLEAELSLTSATLTTAEELRGLADRLGSIEPERATLVARLGELETEVRNEASAQAIANPFTARLTEIATARSAATAPLTAERATIIARRTEKESALAATRSLLAGAADASKKTGFFARLLQKPKQPIDPAEYDRQIQDTERDLKDLTDREAALLAQIEEAIARFEPEREKAITDEIATRRSVIEGRLDALATERDGVAGRFAARVRELDRAGFTPPSQLSVEAANRVVLEVVSRRNDVSARLAAARDRLNELAATAPELVRKYLSDARVVVATPGSLNTDPIFDAERAVSSPAFALLILDHAEELSDSDFVRLSEFAGRWVLAGAVALPDGPRAAPSGHGPRQARPSEAAFLRRLARAIDREPWVMEGDRLVCRLAPVPPGRRLTREPVLDRPEIELRVATDGDEVVLAEIAFPAQTTVPAAKTFLYSQLGEIILRPCGAMEWQRADVLSAVWPAAKGGAGEWLDLEPGIREKVVGSGPAAFTAAVTFDPAAGWDEDKAATWLRARVPAPSTSRLAAIPGLSPPAVGPVRPAVVG